MRDNVSQSVPQFVITNDDHYCNACSVYMHIIERSGNGIFHVFEDARMYGLRDPEIRIFGTPFHYSSHLKSVEPNPLGMVISAARTMENQSSVSKRNESQCEPQNDTQNEPQNGSKTGSHVYLSSFVHN